MHGQTPAGWYADPAPGSPPTRQRYFDGAEWTTNIHDSSPRLSAGDPFSDPVPDGLEAGSGFLAGLIGVSLLLVLLMPFLVDVAKGQDRLDGVRPAQRL